ncbi:MAG TPA: ABC transporter permease [Cellvibrio sp.]|nr:ABC transporter permease [Cellvibrio sp.]
MTEARFNIDLQNDQCIIRFSGDWQLGKAPDGESLCTALPADCKQVTLVLEDLGLWDSSLPAVLLTLARWCEQKGLILDSLSAPQSLQNLLRLATEIPSATPSRPAATKKLLQRFYDLAEMLGREISATLIFIGDAFIALRAWLTGKAKTRRSDIRFFIAQAGPQALPIVTLICVSVGMILAYLGSVQLRQLGAQVYVANLVAIGMVREMAPLMTAIIIAGRTGAAYAAQLGTMRANEEIDALKTMGISAMEFLVLPRLIALIFIMPLICIYANVIGLAGGAIVASGMDVSFKQYILQTQGAVNGGDIFSGMFKSLVFAILIAIAGCQAGLNCGRSSIAVGIATTSAVVRAIVYLVLADAMFNVLYDKLGI